ncbi:M16 family metallopeptidase [Patescibacteria group bacterium]
MSSFRLITLKNGVRVILVPHQDTAAVTVLVSHGVGSLYESKPLNGASHFIEHMMFKGTKRRPDSRTLTRELDSLGADYNAMTSKDYTDYYVKLPHESFGQAVDLLEDMIHHSSFSASDIANERGVIIEEIQMYEDNPIMHAMELMEDTMFGDTPLGWNIAGTRETVTKMTKKDLVAYQKRHYTPKRTVIAVAGKFDEVAMIALLEERFGSRQAPKTRSSAAVPRDIGVAARGPRVVIQKKEIGQVQAAIGFPAYAYGDRRLPALLMLSTILGGTMSSRLYESVREKEGLCYSIHSSPTSYIGAGHFMIQSGFARDGAHKALGIVMKELNKMKTRPVTTEELSRARQYLKGRIMLSLEDSGRLANWYAKGVLLNGKITTPEKRLTQLFSVTKRDILKIAQSLFRRSKLTMAVIGPDDDVSKFKAHASLL